MLELTKDQLEKEHASQLETLVQSAGGPNHLAKMLNVNAMTVRNWISRGRISKDGANLVASHPTFKDYFTAKQLRPDMV